MISIISIVALLLLLVLGVPMVAALMFAVSFNFVMSGQWSMTIPQTMISGVSQFTLIALPLFVLSGTLMNAGGISGRLFDFARSLVGWMRGGLAQVNILTSIFFGGMIGSSTADLAGSGSILIPAMKKEGYSAEISAAVSAASAGVGRGNLLRLFATPARTWRYLRAIAIGVPVWFSTGVLVTFAPEFAG
ncbi:MAG: TRAP transporter large permease subunit, partial [Gemmobacter sp.]